jgi:hypothetical protein
MGATNDPDPMETAPSAVAKWAAVVIIGEVTVVASIIVLTSVLKIGGWSAILLTFALSILIGGRFGGVRGVVEWAIAAVLIVTVASVSGYLFALAIVSQIHGP